MQQRSEEACHLSRRQHRAQVSTIIASLASHSLHTVLTSLSFALFTPSFCCSTFLPSGRKKKTKKHTRACKHLIILLVPFPSRSVSIPASAQWNRFFFWKERAVNTHTPVLTHAQSPVCVFPSCTLTNNYTLRGADLQLIAGPKIENHFIRIMRSVLRGFVERTKRLMHKTQPDFHQVIMNGWGFILTERTSDFLSSKTAQKTSSASCTYLSCYSFLYLLACYY